MANVIHNQKIHSSTKSYAGQFGARENALLTSNFTVLQIDSDAEVKARDGITHVLADASDGDVELVLPAPSQCKGRALTVRKDVEAVNDLTVVAADGSDVGASATFTQTAIATLVFYSTGAAWIRVG